MIRFNNIRKGALLPFCFLFLFALLISTIPAEATTGASFRARAIPHAYQWDEDISYFFLDILQDYAGKALEIEVFNNSDEKKQFHLDFHLAKTNTKGVLVYEKSHS